MPNHFQHGIIPIWACLVLSLRRLEHESILVKVHDDHGFSYEDEKCLALAKKMKELVDDRLQNAKWSTSSEITSLLNMDLTVLLCQNSYPSEWDEEVFEKVMEQTENFKKYK